MFSETPKEVVVLDLKVPWEEQMEEASEQKKTGNMHARCMPIEVGGGALQGSHCARRPTTYQTLLGHVKDKPSAELQGLREKQSFRGCGKSIMTAVCSF